MLPFDLARLHEHSSMTVSTLRPPPTDATPIFELFRGNYATELLAAAVGHLGIFAQFAKETMTLAELRARLGLAERPAIVLCTALRAMGLLVVDSQNRLGLSELASHHLVPGGPFDVGGYVALMSDNPGVREMVERLRTNRPAGGKPDEAGAAFIYREGLDSAMEKEASARRLTLALAGRARNTAAILAERVDASGARQLLDVGGGTGLYSVGFLQRHPKLRAIVWDRPEVLKVAAELAAEYGVAERLECRSGDMFTDPAPADSDLVLLSNVLHDWDVPECKTLLRRCSLALQKGGRLLIHDAFLNDALDGPLAVALYSAALFSLTEGRAYSAAEYRDWLSECGLVAGDVVPTAIHCGVLAAIKT